MAVTKAWMTWTGPVTDVLTLMVADPYMPHWWAVGIDDTDSALLREADNDDSGTGRVAGLEIVGILTFDQWDKLPDSDILWQVADGEPLPLVDLLKQEQQALRQQEKEGAA